MPTRLADTFDNLFYPPHRNGQTDYRYFDGEGGPLPFDPDAPPSVHAWWLADAALLVYETEHTVRAALALAGIRDVQFFGSWTDSPGLLDRLRRLLPLGSTQGFVASSDTYALAVFRGTEKGSLGDALSDILSWKLSEGGCKVHFGFRAALNSVWPTVAKLLAPHRDKALFFTGHSLGAALATLAVSRLEGLPRVSLHVYGSPRVGDRAFCEKVSRHAPGRVARFVNSKDVVTLLPSRRWGFAHVEKEHYIDSRGRIDAIIDPLEQWKDALRAAVDHDLDIAPLQELVQKDDFAALAGSLRAQLRNQKGAGSETPLYLVGNHSPARYPYLLYAHHVRSPSPSS